MASKNLPSLPKLPFIIFDVLLVITALLIAILSPSSSNPMIFFWMIFCVVLGGTLFCLPFLIEYKTNARLYQYQQTQEKVNNYDDEIAGIVEELQSLQQTSSKQNLDCKRAISTIEDSTLNFVSRITTVEKKLAPLVEGSGDFEKSRQFIDEKLSKIEEECHSLKRRIQLFEQAKASAKVTAPVVKEEPAPVIKEEPESIIKEQPAQVVKEEVLPVVEEEVKPTQVKEEAPQVLEPLALEPAAQPLVASQPSEVESAEKLEPAQVSEHVEPPQQTELLPIEEITSEPAEAAQEVSQTVGEQVEVKAEPVDMEATKTPPVQPVEKKKPGPEKTVLKIKTMIGVGNKPFIRGNTGGLSFAKGLPLEFLEIGLWQWTSTSLKKPLTCKIYKNDQEAAKGSPIKLMPGEEKTLELEFD